MASQNFTVCAGDTVIGKVSLEDWDRSMGVAGGIFLPNESYLPSLHASEVDGVARLSSEVVALAIVDALGVEPFSEDIYLVDWASEAGTEGRELTVFGIDILGVFGRKRQKANDRYSATCRRAAKCLWRPLTIGAKLCRP